MNNSVALKDGTELVGLTNIVISEADGKIFINNSAQIESGVKGSLVLYTKDGQLLSSSGLDCIWDNENKILKVKSLNSVSVETDLVNSDTVETTSLESETIGTKSLSSDHIIVRNSLLINDYLETVKNSIKKWIGFESKLRDNEHPLKIKSYVNPSTNQETLCFITNEYSDTKSKVSVALDNDRLYLNNLLNIKEKTIETSYGSAGDVEGDIAVDKNYFYYCIGSFDGVSKIWRRCPLNDW